MSMDVQSEQRVPSTELPKLKCLDFHSGRRIHYTSVWRRVMEGRTGIRLEAPSALAAGNDVLCR